MVRRVGSTDVRCSLALQVWDMRTLALVNTLTLEGHEDAVLNLHFTARMLVTCSMNGKTAV